MATYLSNEEIVEFKNRLNNYPNLHLLLKRLSNIKKYTRDYEFSIFSIVLSNHESWKKFLLKLDSLIVTNIYPRKILRNRIFEDVLSFVSELEIILFFKNTDIQTNPEPKMINGAKLDIKLLLNQEIYLEVITPRLSPSDRDSFKHAAFVPITSDVDKRVINEIDKHRLSNLDNITFKYPLLIFIDGIYKGIDQCNIPSALETLNNESLIISGILLKRIDEKITLFLNKTAQNKLNDKDIAILSKVGITINNF